MAFPDDDLELTCSAAFGADLTADPSTWVFTDLSSRVVDNPITISRGVLVGNGTSKTGSAIGLTLLNTDGALTPMLPTSPYWPYVDLGTPVRLSVRTDTKPYVSDTFTRTVTPGWGTADSGLVWNATANYSTNGSTAQVSFASVNQIGRIIAPKVMTDADAVYDVSIATVATGGPIVTGANLRIMSSGGRSVWAGLEFGVGGGLLWTIRNYIASVATTVGQVAEPVLTYSAGTVIRCRVRLIGDTIRARAWLPAGAEPNTWTVTATVPAPTGPGAFVGFQTWVTPGNTNTLPDVVSYDNLTISQPKYPRFEGFITDVRPSFRPVGDGTTFSVAQVDLGGLGSRLEKREAPAWGPLRRSLQYSINPPYAYWPLEDAAGSTTGAGAYAGQDPMTVTGPVVFDFDTGADDSTLLLGRGSKAICSVAAGGRLSAAVPVAASPTSAWTVSGTIALVTALVGGGYTEIRALEWATPSSTWTRWALISTLTGHTVRAYNDAAGTTSDVVVVADNFNVAFGIDVTATQSGGNISVQLVYVGAVVGSGSVAGTIGPVSRVTINPDRANTTGSVNPFGIRYTANHVMVHDSALASALPFYTVGADLFRADQAWNAEVAWRRLKRLTTEERVPFTVKGDPDTTGNTRLGAQQEASFTDLVSAAADAESGGLLVETGFGLMHVPRSTRYNQTVALTVDLSTHRLMGGTAPEDVLVPKLDARGANYVTVERTNGGSSSFAADAAYRLRRGTIAEQKTLDVYADTDTGPHAQWRVHTAVDGQAANYPNLNLDFAANPGLIDGWVNCDIGSRVQRTNQPTIAGLDLIDQVIDGITETVAPRMGASPPSWTATLDTSPAIVWDTGVWDSATSLWQPSNTTITATLNTTALSFTVNSHGEPWITGAVVLRMQIDAEVITVTNITGAGSSFTFTVTRSVNSVVASHASGAKVVFAIPTRWAL